MLNKKYVKDSLETKSYDKYLELYKKIHEEMAKDTQLTHPNEETAIAGSIFIFMGLCTMQQKYSGKEILEMTYILFENNFFDENDISKNLKNIFEELLNEFSKPNFSKDKFFDKEEEQVGYYMHSFNLTIYYLSIFDEQKEKISLKEFFTNMMFDISDFGGDTDTNGAIVGMIMGPLIGIENFDRKYLDILLSFYSKDRLIYTNIFMYFYVYALQEFEKAPSYERDTHEVNYMFFVFVVLMLNKVINNI